VGAGDGRVAVMNPSMNVVAGKSTNLMGAVTSISVAPDGKGFIVGTAQSNRCAGEGEGLGWGCHDEGEGDTQGRHWRRRQQKQRSGAGDDDAGSDRSDRHKDRITTPSPLSDRYYITFDFAVELRGTCHYGSINSVVFPNNCSDLFITCSTNDIRVWNANLRQELLRIQVPNLDCK
jgi:WD40 repeat protein